MCITKKLPALIILSDEDDWSLEVVMPLTYGFLVNLSDFPSDILPEVIREPSHTTSGFFEVSADDLKPLLTAALNRKDLRYVFTNTEVLLSLGDEYLEPEDVDAKRPALIRAVTQGL